MSYLGQDVATIPTVTEGRIAQTGIPGQQLPRPIEDIALETARWNELQAARASRRAMGIVLAATLGFGVVMVVGQIVGGRS